MSIESIFLVIPAETFGHNRGPGAYALQLAHSMGARLTGLVLEQDVVSPTSWSESEGALASETESQSNNAQARAVAKLLRQAAHDRDIASEFVTALAPGQTLPQLVADFARIADVTVTGTSGMGFLNESLIAEYILFQSGRPLIVIPQHYEQEFRCEHVMVAWDFSRNAARALGDAMPFLHRTTSVSVVTFGDDKALGSSLRSDDLIASLASRGIAARYECYDQHGKSIDSALNDLALTQAADLLVMGGYGHSRLREFILGGATRGILQDPVVPTLLSH